MRVLLVEVPHKSLPGGHGSWEASSLGSRESASAVAGSGGAAGRWGGTGEHCVAATHTS